MINQPQGPQGLLGGQQPQQDQQPRPFPANQTDVKKFRNDIINVLHSEQTGPQIVETIKQGAANIGATLGMIAGSVVMNLIHRRVTEQGIKPHIKLAIMGAKFALEELLNITQQLGIKVTEQDMMAALKVINDIVMQTSGQQPQGQQPQVQPQQPAPPQQQGGGLIGGAGQQMGPVQ